MDAIVYVSSKIKEMKPKTIKTIYWVSTIFIFLFEGVIPALTFQTDLAKQSVRHLGYPEYFDAMVVAFRIFGVIALVIPKMPGHIKEWAYAGFGLEFISAFVSLFVVDGFGPTLLFPIIAFSILTVSYSFYHRIQNSKRV